MALVPRTRLLPKVRELVSDPLYRGSLVLLANTAVLAVFGFVFWTLAARSYPAATVGSFSGLTSGIGLVSAVAGLGLPNMITRHLTRTSSPRGLMVISLGAITALGGALSTIVLLGLGPYLPASLHLQQHGGTVTLFTVLVIVSALSGAIDAGLVAVRATQAVLWTNLAGAATRIAGLLLLTSLRSSGLVIAYSLGLILATLLSVPPLVAKVASGGHLAAAFTLFREYLAGTIRNYVATILGILPSTVVPLEVLAERGAAQTAAFAAAFLVAGFLNVIPSATSQVLFAEASREGITMGGQLRKAIRAIYGLLLPALVVLVVAAPLIMRIFGASYAAQATSCLRILALTALLTGGTYLVDSMLIARDRTGAYLFMNGANAALVLGCVGVALHHGLTSGAEGWAIAQGASLLLGLGVVVAGKTGRHRRGEEARPDTAAETASAAQSGSEADEWRARVPDMTAALTTMPIMLTSGPGVEQSLQALLERLTHRPVAPRPPQRSAPPGQLAYCGIWFPPLAIPVGSRQVRTSRQLPVLTVVSAYSGWIAAVLIPSQHAPDLHAGCWQALAQLGGVPRRLTWATDPAADEWDWFCDALGSAAVLADEQARNRIGAVHAYLERSFLTGQAVLSPGQFNEQLEEWLAIENNRPGPGLGQAPVVLASKDRRAMLALPAQSPGARWHIRALITDRPYVRFDSNDYSVDPMALGRPVRITADLAHVEIFCDDQLVAIHPRAWSRATTITHPAHMAVRPERPADLPGPPADDALRAEVLHPEPQGLRSVLEDHDATYRTVEVALVQNLVVLDRGGDAGDIGRIIAQPPARGAHHAPLGEAKRLAVLPGEGHDLSQSPRLALQARPADSGIAGVARHTGVVDVDPDHVHHAVSRVVAGERDVPVAGIDVPVEQEVGAWYRAHRPHDPCPVNGPVAVLGGVLSERVVIPGSVHLVTEPDHRITHSGRHEAGGKLPRVPVVGASGTKLLPVRWDAVGNHLLCENYPAARRVSAEPLTPVVIAGRGLGEPGLGPLGPRRVRVVVQQHAVHWLPRQPGEAGQGAHAAACVNACGLGVERMRGRRMRGREEQDPADGDQDRRYRQAPTGHAPGVAGPRAAMPCGRTGRAGRCAMHASRHYRPSRGTPPCHPHHRTPGRRRRTTRPGTVAQDRPRRSIASFSATSSLSCSGWLCSLQMPQPPRSIACRACDKQPKQGWTVLVSAHQPPAAPGVDPFHDFIVTAGNRQPLR
jgi:O-antigen/teichoic acid export membrane protein